METLIGAVVVFVLGYMLGLDRKAKDQKQNEGEKRVSDLLKNNFKSPNYHLIDDITLPTEQGTTQIDHVLLSTKGIFVIETKHYNGWIFGDENRPRWVQTFKSGTKNSFQNPTHQNLLHINECINTLKDLPSHFFHSIVVFTGDGVLKNGTSDKVKYLQQLDSHIRGYSLDVISQDDVFKAIGKLEVFRKERSEQTDREHIAFLKRKHGIAANELPSGPVEHQSSNKLKLVSGALCCATLIAFVTPKKEQNEIAINKPISPNPMQSILSGTKSYSEHYLERARKRQEEIKRKAQTQPSQNKSLISDQEILNKSRELIRNNLVKPSTELANELIAKPFAELKKQQLEENRQRRKQLLQNLKQDTKTTQSQSYGTITQCDDSGKNCRTQKYTFNK